MADCLSLDANRWTREGVLRAGVRQTGTWTYRSGRTCSINFEVNTLDPTRASVRLWYTWVWPVAKESGSADYHLALATTRPRLGGPAVVVHLRARRGRAGDRRVGKLYLPPRGGTSAAGTATP